MGCGGDEGVGNLAKVEYLNFKQVRTIIVLPPPKKEMRYLSWRTGRLYLMDFTVSFFPKDVRHTVRFQCVYVYRFDIRIFSTFYVHTARV